MNPDREERKKKRAKKSIADQIGRQQKAYADKKPSTPMKISEAKNMGQLLRSQSKQNSRASYNASRGNNNSMRNYMNLKKKK